MSTYTSEQFERLPKWAQREIERLNRDLDYWKAKASEGPEEGSNTFTDFADIERPLERGAHIRFQLDPDDWQHKVEARLTEDGYVEVRSAKALEVQPVSSNVIRVRPGEWWH